MWRIVVAGNKKNAHRSLRLVFVILPSFNQICSLSPDFKRSLQYQISWKSLQWDSR